MCKKEVEELKDHGDYQCKIQRGEKYPYSIFNIYYPIGEIIYEENNKDELLAKINETPEFICFVNKMQSKTFNEFNNVRGGQDSYETKYYKHQYIDSKGKKRNKWYRFYAQSFMTENKNRKNSIWQNDS